jgi:hypothetical protein
LRHVQPGRGFGSIFPEEICTVAASTSLSLRDRARHNKPSSFCASLATAVTKDSTQATTNDATDFTCPLRLATRGARLVAVCHVRSASRQYTIRFSTANDTLEARVSSMLPALAQYPGTMTRMSSRPNTRKKVVFRLGRDTMSSPAITHPWKRSACMLDYRHVVDLPRRPLTSSRTLSLEYGGWRDPTPTMASPPS